VDLERLLSVPGVEAEVLPQPGGLDEDLGALADEEVDIAARVEVALQREGDGGVDVVLRSPRRVVRGCLLAIDGAPRKDCL
jgi:hypothetical protein